MEILQPILGACITDVRGEIAPCQAAVHLIQPGSLSSSFSLQEMSGDLCRLILRLLSNSHVEKFSSPLSQFVGRCQNLQRNDTLAEETSRPHTNNKVSSHKEAQTFLGFLFIENLFIFTFEYLFLDTSAAEIWKGERQSVVLVCLQI